MTFDLLEAGTQRDVSAVCRLSADGMRWRVAVESWEALDGHCGRLRFEPDGLSARFEARTGPVVLRGSSRAEIVAAAHEIPERRLVQVLNSLG